MSDLGPYVIRFIATRFLNLFSHGLLACFASIMSIVISLNDLLTSMTEMSELRFLHHFSIIKYSISKNMSVLLHCTKKGLSTVSNQRGNLYHCSQLERLLSYFSSLCVLLKHSMLDPYAKENYSDMLNAGFLDNKVLEIL